MENRREKDEIEIDLLEVLHILLGRAWLILGVGLFFALVCFMVSKFILVPIYESTTKIYILNKTDDSSVTYSDVQMGTQLTKDYAELINSRYVLEEVIQKLGLKTEYRELLKQVRKDVDRPIAALLDTKGPKIRTGLLKDEKKVILQEGQEYEN